MFQQFQWKPKLETMFHLLNLFAALFLFSRSSLFPMIITLQPLSYYRTLFLPLFSDPFYVFLLLNSIILFLYALSNSHTSDDSNDLYNEFLTKISTPRVASSITIPEEKQTVAALHSSSENQKPVKPSEVVEESPHSPVLDRTVTAVTTTRDTTTTCCTATTTTTTTCRDKVPEKKWYRRVRSESYERHVVMAGSGGTELRRMSSSGLRRHGRLCHVEQLNKDEFNRAVEDFIAKQKRMLWEEQNQSHKPEN